MIRRGHLLSLAVLLPSCFMGLSCGLEERGDFLVGRSCDPGTAGACDERQTCLPHRIVGGRLDDFRCRDEASFRSADGAEPPLAYCGGDGLSCPGSLVCNADRVRLDGGPRPLVCKAADDLFAPPLDTGT